MHHLQTPVPIFIVNDYDEGVADVKCLGATVCYNSDCLKITGFKSFYDSQSEINTSNWSYSDRDAYQMNAITFVLTLQLNSQDNMQFANVFYL